MKDNSYWLSIMSPLDFNDNGEIDGEDFFLLNGPLGGKNQNGNNNDNDPIGCGVVIVLMIVMFLLAKCIF